MPNIEFVQEPGYMYDLYFLFILYFNYDVCLSDMAVYDKSVETEEHFQQLLEEVAPIPEELLPFFYLKEGNKSFIAHYYYETYDIQLLASSNITLIRNSLQNHDRVLTNMLQFYFPELTDEEVEQCKVSFPEIARRIKCSLYDDRVKSSLYWFFLEPATVIEKLSYELLLKDLMLSKKYEAYAQQLELLKYQFDFTLVSKLLNQIENTRYNFVPYEKVCVSFCICASHHISGHFDSSEYVLVLGVNYTESLRCLLSRSNTIDYSIFGTVLSERNRVEILKLLYEENELPIKVIGQRLKLSGTTAHYHLSMMVKCNMLLSRNQGRTILYRINCDYFKDVCNTLDKFTHTNERS